MTTQNPPRRRRWLRWLLRLSLILVLLVIALYFVVTSATFLDVIVLPKLSHSLQAEITVSDASISPFSQIVFRNLKVQTPGDTPLLSSREVRARYNLRQIWTDDIQIDEISFDQARLHLVIRPDGSTNLDPLFGKRSTDDRAGSSRSSVAGQVHVRKIAMQQARIELIRHSSGNGAETLVVSNLNLTLNNLRTGGSGTFDLGTALLWQSQPAAPAVHGVMAANVDAKFTFELNDQLQPISLQGRTDFAVQHAEGRLQHFQGLRSAIESQVTPSEVRQLRLSFNRMGTNFGVAQISGPFDLAEQRGDLQLVVHSIDHHLLNLLGSGFEFGSNTSLISTNRIGISRQGIRLSGQTTLNALSMTRGAQVVSDGSVQLQLDAWVQDQSRHIKGLLTLSNVTGRFGQYELTNVTAWTSLDLSNRQRMVEVRQIQIALPSTERAQNRADLSGHLDFSDSAGLQGQLTLAAESLDLTPFYALVRAEDRAPVEPESEQPDAGTPPDEPDPIHLPLNNLTTELRIGQLFLHELTMSDWLTRVMLEPEKMSINPGELWINGAPVKLRAEINLGVPGYGYDVDFSAQSIPIEPLANSFLEARPGAYKGELLAQIHLKGAGITGRSLRENLQGNASLTFTNADLQLVSPFFQRFLSPIAKLIGVPDLLQTPLNHLILDASADSGQIRIRRCQLQSSLFSAETQGAAPIADRLADSPIHDWPMPFSLRRGLVERIRMVPEDTPADVHYIRLPDFVQVTGTLFQPAPKFPHVDALKTKASSVLNRFREAQTDDPERGDEDASERKRFNPLDLFRKRE